MNLKRINGDVIGKGETLKEIAQNNTADLWDADLSYASLRSANLRHASLRHADLRHADLSYADLSYASLRSANLRSADLRSADLSYANLSYANLRSAYFKETKRYDWVINKPPIQISGLVYGINIFCEHMEIGCEKHSFNDWSNFTDKRILEMDGREALEFWNKYKWFLLSLCEERS